MITIVIYPNNTVSFRDEEGDTIHHSMKKSPARDILERFKIPENRRGHPDGAETFFRGDYCLKVWSNQIGYVDGVKGKPKYAEFTLRTL